MSTPVISARRTDTLTHLRNLLRKQTINHIPIVDEIDMPVGMVSAVDLNRLSNWRSQFSELAHASDKQDKHLFDSLLAEEIMSTPVITISQEATVKEAADLIEQHRIHCLPVVNRAGRMVGIISAHDLLRLAYNTLTGPRN
jgi:CBS domain-containing protein